MILEDKLTRFVRGTEINSFINLIFLDDIPSRPGAPSLRQLITFFISNSFVGFNNSVGSMLSGKNCICERLFSGILDASVGPIFTK